jgi:hypothetical protein
VRIFGIGCNIRNIGNSRSRQTAVGYVSKRARKLAKFFYIRTMYGKLETEDGNILSLSLSENFHKY